jgi:hypothetical protein
LEGTGRRPRSGRRTRGGNNQNAERWWLRSDNPERPSLEATAKTTLLVVTDKGHCTEPDRLQTIITDRRPGETAFLLARPEAGAPFRYRGVARWLEPDGPWSLPALDFQTWRALGRERECSRRLPATAIDAATTLLDALPLRAPPGTWLARDGERCRILERTPAGETLKS